MDGQFSINLEAVLQHIEKAETFSIALPTVKRALVIDMRTKGDDGPFVRVMPMARTASERLRSLRRLRPTLPRAAEILVVPWPSFVDGLVRAGIWQRLQQRVASSGSAAAADALDDSLTELRVAESRELGALLRGEEYEVLWAKAK
ncbi:MAG: hypothetical protein O3B04_05800 [Chloroflexi bacterium]|nr:hypothetical protein [Chloroflexota bacterium]